MRRDRALGLPFAASSRNGYVLGEGEVSHLRVYACTPGMPELGNVAPFRGIGWRHEIRQDNCLTIRMV